MATDCYGLFLKGHTDKRVSKLDAGDVFYSSA